MDRRLIEAFPIGLFGSVMGMSGLALGWRMAYRFYAAPEFISVVTSILAAAMFVGVSCSYLLKMVLYPKSVLAELRHPIAGGFLGTFFIALLLLSNVVAPWSALTGEILWLMGVVGCLLVAYFAAVRLVLHKVESLHATPVWIISGVGVLDVPVTSVGQSFSLVPQLNILCFAIGALLAAIFVVLIFYRLIFHDMVPGPLVPSLAILFAPFPVGFLGYVNGISHRIDLFSSLMFYTGLFLFAVMTNIVVRRRPGFGPTWWAVSFPLAALAGSTIEYAGHLPSQPAHLLSLCFLALVTLILAALLLASIWQTARGRFISVGS